MISAPTFWYKPEKVLLPALLSPFAMVTASVSARRVKRQGWRAPVPVVCCGNVTVGGAGKTTLAIDLAQRLVARGWQPHFILRGFGGSTRGTWRVMPADIAAGVGDEALLLAKYATTWIGIDRARSAQQAVAAGASVLILDDGLQNPTLVKDLSFLVVDGGAGFGNGRLLPAGPLREPIASGANRCQAAVLIGEDTTDASYALPAQLPVLRARLIIGQSGAELNGRRVLAFAGIGRPDKFFATVGTAGAILVERISLPDHQPFHPRLFRRVVNRARSLNALPVTTAKDAARMTVEQRAAVYVVDVTLAWDNPREVEALLDQAMEFRNTSMDRSRSISAI